MHEFSLAQSVADLVLESAAREGISRIHRVSVVVGEWSAVMPDALTISFSAIAGVSGPVLEGAVMAVRLTAAAGECEPCSLRFTADDQGLHCPACGGPARLLTGTELYVDSYEGD